MASVDLKSAFNSVGREAVWNAAVAKGGNALLKAAAISGQDSVEVSSNQELIM